MKFLIGDLVVEKRVNHWFFATRSYGYTMLPYPYEGDYWDEYYKDSLDKKPYIGIVIEIFKNPPNGYQLELYQTYKVMWLNCPRQEQFMMTRRFYGDELRLLSKINYNENEGRDESR